MKKFKIILLVILSIIVILGSLIFTFPQKSVGIISQIYENIKVLFVFSKPLDVNLENKSQGIPRQKSYIGLINGSKNLIETENYDLATQQLNQAIRENSDIISPYLLLGEIYIRTKNFTKLDTLISVLEKKFPDFLQEISVLKAKKLLVKQEFNEAFKILTYSVNNEKNISNDLQFYYAMILAMQNKFEESHKILKELKKLPISNIVLNVNENGVFTEKTGEQKRESVSKEFAKKIRELLFIFEEFEKISDGTNPHLLTLMAKKLAENNEFAMAKKFSELAIKEEIGYIDAWIVLGYAEMMLNNKKVALETLRHAYKLDPIKPETHYFLALALEENDELDEATLFFEKSLENNFNFSTEVKFKLIKIFSKKQQFEKVSQLYQELAEKNPVPSDFVSEVNNTINVLKKPEIALKITELLLDKNPVNTLAMNLHAWALISNEKFFEAENLLKKVIKLNPKNSRTLLNLGLLYEKQNKISSAIEFYRQSYEFGNQTSFQEIANLSAERYNKLTNEERPENLEKSNRKAHSP